MQARSTCGPRPYKKTLDAGCYNVTLDDTASCGTLGILWCDLASCDVPPMVSFINHSMTECPITSLAMLQC